MALYKEYADKKAVGTFATSNFGGIEILDLVDKNNDLAVVACFNFGTGRQQIRRHTIKETASGRMFIRKAGRRYYLDQFMRV